MREQQNSPLEWFRDDWFILRGYHGSPGVCLWVLKSRCNANVSFAHAQLRTINLHQNFKPSIWNLGGFFILELLSFKNGVMRMNRTFRLFSILTFSYSVYLKEYPGLSVFRKTCLPSRHASILPPMEIPWSLYPEPLLKALYWMEKISFWDHGSWHRQILVILRRQSSMAAVNHRPRWYRRYFNWK